jgi:hypothetical protein
VMNLPPPPPAPVQHDFVIDMAPPPPVPFLYLLHNILLTKIIFKFTIWDP